MNHVVTGDSEETQEVTLKQEESRNQGEEARGSSAFTEHNWEELKQIIEAQADVIKELQEQVMKNAAPRSQRLTPASLRTKPKDIPILELTDLEGLEATGRLWKRWSVQK